MNNWLPFKNRYFISLAAAISAVVIANPSAYADELLFPNSDFETGTLQNWTPKGEAFKVQPTKGDNTQARNRETSNLQGDWWIGGYERYNGITGKPGDTAGDKLTGTLTSRDFEIKYPYITFRIGAGHLPGSTGVRLLVDNEEIELASGIDSETMVEFSANVEEFKGKSARLQIFDSATGGWGHINVDDFRGTTEPVPTPDAMKTEFSFTGNISASAYPDVGYDQANRPQFHFVSKKNWLNDPNGMVFDGERYHLFFQHNPQGTNWGNMTWGHAVSHDMVRWTQLDHALLPYRVDRRAGTIFSGTAIVDHNDSLGMQSGDTKTLCAFFTFAAQPKFYQAMAYSTDGGESWTYWNEGKAVVPNQGFDSGERDPKVFWHEQTQRWIMALWVQRSPGRVRFFTSKNLTDWEFASDLMRDWAYECMDVVFLPVDNNPKDVKCVIYDASFDYEVGQFDGKTFRSETPKRTHAAGSSFYAAQTFNSGPDDRVVQIGWMRGGPNSAQQFRVPHNQQMSFPCELTLKKTPDGIKLFCWPIAEIGSLVSSEREVRSTKLDANENAIAEVGELDLVDLEMTFSPGNSRVITITLPRVTLKYFPESGELRHAGVNKNGQQVEVVTLKNILPRDGQVSLRVLVDRLSVEVFAFEGEQFAAHYINPEHAPKEFSIHSTDAGFTVDYLKLNKLKSAWDHN